MVSRNATQVPSTRSTHIIGKISTLEREELVYIFKTRSAHV
jgi:hypothetical protein